MKFIYGILTLAALAGMGWAAWNYLQLTEQAPGLNPWLLFTDANPMLKKLKMAAMFPLHIIRYRPWPP